MGQAKKDLSHAEKSMELGDYEWACFASQQAAEKAVKALFQALSGNAFGHSVSMLLTKLPRESAPDGALIDMAKRLDKHYVPARYPNLHPEGAPLDYYTKADAKEAIEIAGHVVEFCEGGVRSIQGDD